MPTSKYKLLVAEDEPDIRTLVRTLLESAGYQVIVAENGETAKMMYASHTPDLILLDVGLPDMDGRDILRSIRKQSAVPVIMLSANNEEEVVVQALDLGANDYVRKPFGAAELLARVRNTIRASFGPGSQTVGKFESNGLLIDFEARIITLEGTEIHLTQTEYNIIALLARHCGKMLTYNQICKEIWGYTDAGSTKKLQVNMANIRKKFSGFSTGARHIQNELGVGYRMRNAEEK